MCVCVYICVYVYRVLGVYGTQVHINFQYRSFGSVCMCTKQIAAACFNHKWNLIWNCNFYILLLLIRNKVKNQEIQTMMF